VAIWLGVIIGQPVLGQVASLSDLAGSANPYFIPDHAALLYIAAPLVVLGACILFFSPGMLLILAMNSAKSLGQWVLFGFGVSLVGISLAAGIFQAISHQPLQGTAFAWLVVILSGICLGFLVIRVMRKHPVGFPLQSRIDWITLISMVIVPFAIIVLLAPKFYWENFNGDGAHAIETARLLLFRVLPFWNPDSGNITGFPGLSSMLFAYPMSWFVRLFGDTEAAARVLYILCLIVLYAALLALIEIRNPIKFGIPERFLLWFALFIITIVLAYNATYSPYFADLAMPASQDILALVAFLGYTFAFENKQKGWVLLFLILSMLALPSGIILVGFWLLSVAIINRPIPWKSILFSLGIIFAFAIFSFLAPLLLKLVNLPAPGQEYGLIYTLSHFAFFQVADFSRILYVLIPAGIFPALSLLAWSWQDRIARQFTILTVLYFLFLYFPAYTALHYFFPLMIFPLVVFWRIPWSQKFGHETIRYGIVLAGLTVALIISIPKNLHIDTNARSVGETIDNRVGDYWQLEPAAYRSTRILRQVFPLDWDASVPDDAYGGSALAWNYYSRRKDLNSPINMVIQGINENPPLGMELLISDDEFEVFILDRNILDEQQSLKPPTPAGDTLFSIPRGFLFRTIENTDGPRIFSVIEILEYLGFDVDPILDRFGVDR